MPYWGAFPAIGPIPQGKASDPAKYAAPVATGPYMIEEYTPEKSLILERNDQWDPATDPARTQYPDGYDFKTSDGQTRRSTRSCSTTRATARPR